MSTLGFEVQWFDNVAGLMKTLYLKFFLEDNTIEIVQDKGIFLKRIFLPDVHIEDLYIGGSVTVFNRLLSITGFANSATEKYMRDREVRLCYCTSKLIAIGDIIDLAETHGFRLGRVKPTSISIPCVCGVDVRAGDTIFEFVGGVGNDAPGFCEKVLKFSENRIALISFSDITDILSLCRPIEVPIDSTLCLIKPHVIKEKSSGKILREIGGAGFRVVGLYAIHMTPQMAEELFDVYSNIYPSYSKVVQHITSGPCLAAVVTGSVEVVNEFRAFAGPLNPELAKVLRPDSLRARFGKNDITNGIHCTDLPGDGEMECRYFFETLASL